MNNKNNSQLSIVNYQLNKGDALSLPKGWEIKKLGEVCEFQNGKAHEKIIDKKGKYILINSKFISSNGEKYKKTKEQLKPLFKGDIVFVMSDVPNGQALAKCFLVDKNDFYTLNQRICVIRTNRFDKKYLFYHLNRHKYLLSFNNGENQTNLRKNDILNCPLILPPLPEQKRIVSILDRAFETIDQAKANAEQNLKNAKEIFESYLQGVFENNSCKKEQIKHLTSLVTKGSSPNWQGINYVDNGGIFFLTSKNVGEGELLLNNKKYLEEKFNDIQKTSILQTGDVLTNIVGASIGRTAIFDLEEITNINQAVCLMRCIPDKIYNYYLMYLLNSPFFKNILHDNEVNNARANLSLTFFKNLLIPLPALSEQIKIVETIKKISAETKKLEKIYQKKIEDLEELKKSILQKAFTGQL